MCIIFLNNDILLFNSDLTLKGIVFGSNKLDKNSTSAIVAQIDRTFMHPDYNRYSYINDVAVLQLSKPITWTDYVRPVCLQMSTDEVETYSTCYVAGWGQMWPPDQNVCKCFTDFVSVFCLRRYLRYSVVIIEIFLLNVVSKILQIWQCVITVSKVNVL